MLPAIEFPVPTASIKGSYVLDGALKWLREQLVALDARCYFNSLLAFCILIRFELDDDFETKWSTPFLHGPGKRISQNKKHKTLDIALYVPCSVWQQQTQGEFNRYFCKQIVECFNRLHARAEKIGELKDGSNLREDFLRLMERFLAEAPTAPSGQAWESKRYLELKAQGKLKGRTYSPY